MAYTLSSGYLTRNQSICFKLEGSRGATKPVSKVTTLMKSTPAYFQRGKSYSKDKFSGGKLFFETFYDGPMDSSSREKHSNIRGRLPNILCDVLLPLLRAKVVDLRGHVAYDLGSTSTFHDVPISLHILVNEAFFRLSNGFDESDTSYGIIALIEAANDLLIWLTDGDAALVTSRQSRSDAKKAAEQALSVPSPAQDDVSDIDKELAAAASEGLDDTQRGSSTVDTIVGEKLEDILADFPQSRLFADNIVVKKYQLQAVTFMKNRERDHTEAASSEEVDKDKTYRLLCPTDGLLSCVDIKIQSTEYDSQSLWTPIIAVNINDLRRPQDVAETLRSDESIKNLHDKVYWWNRYSHKIQRDLPTPPLPCNGGILADVMGIGSFDFAKHLYVVIGS